MPETYSSKDERAYHFDYLTLLLTAALDAETLIINRLYQLGLNDKECGLSRPGFRRAIKNNPNAKPISDFLDSKEDFIEILFPLRNKIHSISLGESFMLPDNYQDDLFDKIYNFNTSNHWGIQKQKTTLIKNNDPPVRAYDISIDIYKFALHLIEEGFVLIDGIIQETKAELFLDAASSQKFIDKPPPDLAETIELYILSA